jgi:hypothetical protein
MQSSGIRSVRRLLLKANVPSSPILATLMMEAVRSYDTSDFTRATRRNMPEDGILYMIYSFPYGHSAFNTAKYIY